MTLFFSFALKRKRSWQELKPCLDRQNRNQLNFWIQSDLANLFHWACHWWCPRPRSKTWRNTWIKEDFHWTYPCSTRLFNYYPLSSWCIEYRSLSKALDRLFKFLENWKISRERARRSFDLKSSSGNKEGRLGAYILYLQEVYHILF